MSSTSTSLLPAPVNASKAELLASLPALERQQFWLSLSPEEAAALEYDWRFWGRPNQHAPAGNWVTWLPLAGRGFGKTRIGAEWVREQVESERCGRLALVAETAADARDVMVEGESGLLSVCPPWSRPRYEPSKRRLTWPNGATATTYSADDPEQLRGPQHDGAWCDEIGKWHSTKPKDGSHTRAESAWSNLMFGLRLGSAPRCVATSTPRPTPLVRQLVADPDTVVTRGTTYENLLNLAPSFRSVIQRYEGTRLGRQELNAELLDDVEGALWTLSLIESLRWRREWGEVPDLQRSVVAVDPSGGGGAEHDEVGIVHAGRALCTCQGAPALHYFVLADASGRYTPDGWGRRAVGLYHNAKADRLVAEQNFGGDMVEHTVRTVDRAVSYRALHASRGKAVRAEPIAALYEQAKVHHVGLFPEMEDEMTQYVPGVTTRSPNRMDALVWALTELAEHNTGGRVTFL